MLLAIDVGNTNTVFALFKDDALLESWRMETERGLGAQAYAEFLQEAFEGTDHTFEKIDGAIVSSVVPETNPSLDGFCKSFLDVEAVFVGKDTAQIEIDLKNPNEVGADRLVNAVAVKAHYSTPAIVIDFGTATTFDVIDEDGRYSGGVIAPGIDLSVHMLHMATSQLPEINVENPGSVIGKSTVHAMQSGIYHGYKSLIDGVVAGIKTELGGGDVLVLATGGLAGLFAEDSDVIDQVDEALILKGLSQIYKGLK